MLTLSSAKVDRVCGRRRAFTIVELLICVGVVMVLIGLMVPGLMKTTLRAEQTRDMAMLQQNVALIHAYLGDQKEVFPIGHSKAFMAAQAWHLALEKAGVLREAWDADPIGQRDRGPIRFWQSVALMNDPELMVLGSVPPPDQVLSQGVRLSQVVFPSRKGSMHQWVLRIDRTEVHFCCGYEAPSPMPIAFVDASVDFKRRTDLVTHEPVLTVVNHVGVPIYSTWGGFRSFDR